MCADGEDGAPSWERSVSISTTAELERAARTCGNLLQIVLVGFFYILVLSFLGRKVSATSHPNHLVLGLLETQQVDRAEAKIRGNQSIFSPDLLWGGGSGARTAQLEGKHPALLQKAL